MSTLVDRLQRASTRFFFHYEEMEVQVHSFSKAEWAQLEGSDPTNNRRFGWIGRCCPPCWRRARV